MANDLLNRDPHQNIEYGLVQSRAVWKEPSLCLT